MSYQPPALRITQELVSRPLGNTLPLYPVILAPQYGLHRFSEEDEQALLGAYDKDNGNTFTEWPDKDANSDVDVATSALWLKDAILQYHQFSVDGSAGADVGLLTNDGNRIRVPTLVFKTGNGTDRSTVFGNRDVTIGDYISISFGAVTVETIVTGLVADIVASVIGAASAAASNVPNTTEAGDSSYTGNWTDVLITGTVDASSYDGLADGYTKETYVCTVIQTDGTLTNTYVRIDSASGTDDVASKQLSASGVATVCGTRGAEFTITDGGGTAALGDSFTIIAAQDYTAPTLTSGGTYTGSRDTSYIIEITQGGVIDTDEVKFQVSTTNGYDAAVSTTIPVAGGAGTYVVGNYGATIAFAGADQLVTGDQYVIEATAETEGAYQTLVVAENLTGATTNDVLAVVLGLMATIELDETEWTATAAQIAVTAGAKQVGTYLGASQQFDVLSGNMYMDYRELLKANANSLNSLDDPLDIAAATGPVVPENPLSFMLWAALSNCDGTDVFYMALESDDLAGYTAASELLTEVSEVYSLVPYSMDDTVNELLEQHVDTMSSPNVALFRILWRGVGVERYSAYYIEDASEDELLATVTGTALECTNALFVTNGVRAGDSVHINYRPDNRGNIIYDTYKIDSVDSETELTLVSGPSTPITVAIKMEVWRTATLAEYADEIKEVAGTNDRRVTAVWCEPIEMLGYSDVAKSIMCAALAGLRAAGAPHQPLTNVNVDGVDLNLVNNFGSFHLNEMAAAGVWLVVKDVQGNIYTRQQLTTDMSDLEHQEQSITTNLDHISRDFKTAVSDLYGRGNVSDEMLELIRSRIYSTKSTITARDYSAIIGPQLQDLTIVRIYVDESARDHVWADLEPELPYPMNFLDMNFRLI